MDKEKYEKLTSSQLTACLSGFVLGAGVLILPRILAEAVYQDAWISACIALVYPLYIVLVSSYIAKEHPENNILNINRKYFGKFFGNMINGIFGLQFFIYSGTVIGDYNRIAEISIVGFLSPLKVIIFCIIATAYAASKGVKVFGKLSEVINVFIIPVILITLFVFKEGSIGNFKPAFDAGLPDIIKISKSALYFYIGFEGLVLIHPYVQKGVDIKKASLKAFAFCSIIWVWSVAATIIYLGPDLIKKSLWPFTLVYSSVNFPIINNVRYIFMFSWSLATFRLLSGHILLSHTVINDFIKINMSSIFYVTLPLLGAYAYIATDTLIRQKIVNTIPLFYVIFNILFLSSIMLISRFKKKGTSKG